MTNFICREVNINNFEIDSIKIAMKKAKKTKNTRHYQRYSVILKHLNGFTNKDIATIENLNAHTVGIYVKNYKERGILGLNMNYSTGAKRKLSKAQEIIIFETIINNTPDNVGFESRKNWTIEIVRQWIIKEFNVKMCHKGIAIVLHRLNLSYTRPTYVLKKADKEKQKIYMQDFLIIKKN